MTEHEAVRLLQEAFQTAVAAANPARTLPEHLPPPPKGRLVVVGAGKAAAGMARATETFYGERYPGVKLGGLVITRYGHAELPVPTEQLKVIEASHPVPDAAGVAATEEILALAEGLGKADLLVCLISGGGSALLCAPDGVTLSQKAALTEALLRSGADITEMNTVRKHLSRVKGGGLARAAFPARVVSLIVSDVAGDELSVIASGPTVPDSSTSAEARAVLERYGLEPPSHLSSAPETPKPGDPVFERVQNHLIASAQGMLSATATFFRERGITPLILSESVTGEARDIAKMHAAIARQVRTHGQPLGPPCVLLSGGETTVTVRGDGRGGRNCEFALSLGLELNGLAGVYALAADTDGIDGTEDAAGAVVTPQTLASMGRAEAQRYLDNNDAYSFFERVGGLVRTGPTLTNVNDVRMILVL